MDKYFELIHETPFWDEIEELYDPTKERVQELPGRASPSKTHEVERICVNHTIQTAPHVDFIPSVLSKHATLPWNTRDSSYESIARTFREVIEMVY